MSPPFFKVAVGYFGFHYDLTKTRDPRGLDVSLIAPGLFKERGLGAVRSAEW